jgi:hypothetical protein
MTQSKANFAVGDLLTFKAATRSHYHKATRVITGIDSYGRPLVSYHGWSGFVVRPDEIISASKRPDAQVSA